MFTIATGECEIAMLVRFMSKVKNRVAMRGGRENLLQVEKAMFVLTSWKTFSFRAVVLNSPFKFALIKSFLSFLIETFFCLLAAFFFFLLSSTLSWVKFVDDARYFNPTGFCRVLCQTWSRLKP